MENIVSDYLKKSEQTLDVLAHDEDDSHLTPARNSFNEAHQALTGVWERIYDFFENRITKRQFQTHLRNGKSFLDIYGMIFKQAQPGIDREIAAKDRELNKMLDSFTDLTGSLRERAKTKMELLQSEIDALKAQQLTPASPLESLKAELTARRDALASAEKTMSKAGAGDVRRTPWLA